MKDKKRLRRLVWALGVSCLAAAVLAAWPSPDEAARKELARVLQGGPPGDLAALFRRVYQQGDDRAQCKIAGLILKEPDSGPELDQIVDLAVRDVWAWNTELPRWKVQVLQAWLRAHGMADTPRGRRFLAAAPVAFFFRGESYSKLYLEGDWDPGGEIATVHGWGWAEMKRGRDGLWTCRQRLRLTRLRHAYHVVVRTAPWPAGRAVGSAIFVVHGARTVAVPPMPPNAIPDRQQDGVATATPPPGEPVIGVAVLGIDGGTWRVILPWVHQGYLPNFARLLREGAVADEIASAEDDGYPSPPNIYSAMTGKLRFRHGMNRGIGGDYFTTSLFRTASPIWRIASDHGLHTASVGMEGTFPPDELDGEMVTEAFFAANAYREAEAKTMFHDPSVEAFAQFFGVSFDQLAHLALALRLVSAVMATTTPHDLGAELQRAVHSSKVRGADLVGLTLSRDIGVTQAVRYLSGAGRYGLLCAYLTGADAASHMYWSEILPPDQGEAPFQAKRGHVFEAYRNADELLGVLLDRSRAVVLFSDHGFGALGHDVVLPVVDVPRLVRVLGEALGKRIAPEASYYQTNAGGKLRRGWTFWLTAQEERPLAGRLAAALASMAYLPQGRPVFADAAIVREGGRLGVRFLEAPMLETAKAIAIEGRLHPVGDVLASVRLSSSHMANGVFAVLGPQARPGALEHAVKIVDVAPTALYLAGLPLARDMDGRLAAKAIQASYLAARPPSFVPSYGAGGAGWVRLLEAIDWRRAWGNLARLRAPENVQ